MNLLAIETSTEYCSLAVSRDGAMRAEHFHAGQRHAELVLPAVARLLAEAGLALGDLDGIAYGMGPGAFTGLRIACGVTQGLALARGIPVVGVVTLQALAEECDADAAVTCLDARMGEVYHAAYRKRGDATGPRWEEVLAPGLYAPADVPVPPGDGWSGCGSGFAAHGDMLMRRYADKVAAAFPQRVPTGAAVLRLALPVFAAGGGKDAAEALPLYLRDKVALKKGEQ